LDVRSINTSKFTPKLIPKLPFCIVDCENNTFLGGLRRKYCYYPQRKLYQNETKWLLENQIDENIAIRSEKHIAPRDNSRIIK